MCEEGVVLEGTVLTVRPAPAGGEVTGFDGSKKSLKEKTTEAV